MNNRRFLLLTMLAVTLSASIWTWWSDKTETVVAAMPTPRHAKASPPAIETQATVIISNTSSHTIATATEAEAPQDLFNDAAAAIAVAPPAPPTAPELPFVYAGKLLQDTQYAVFLSMGERNLVVHQGDIIEQQWRVDSITPPTMQLSYLPMRIKRVMNIGAAN